jgi:hypothetical protein
MNAAGTGFLDDLTDKIQCEIDTGLDNVPDNVNLFDGLVVHETVKRLDRDLIEFTVRSWDAELTEFNAEEVADTTANPIKNITGLTVNSVAIGGMGGVYKLKYRIDVHSTFVWYWMSYDGGTERRIYAGGSYDLYNAHDTDNPRSQYVTITAPADMDDLPGENAEDALVLVPGGQGNMQVSYWYENKHLAEVVALLYAKAGVTGVTAKVKAIDRYNGEKHFSYFNDEAATTVLHDCVYVGDDWFVFAQNDKLMKVQRKSNGEALTYTEIGTVTAGKRIYRLWYTDGYIWGVIGAQTQNGLYCDAILKASTSAIISETAIPNIAGRQLNNTAIDIDSDGHNLYYVLHSTTVSTTSLVGFCFATETFDAIYTSGVEQHTASCTYAQGSVYWWAGSKQRKWDIAAGTLSERYYLSAPGATQATVYNSADGKFYTTLTTGGILGMWFVRDGGLSGYCSPTHYLFRVGAKVFGWTSGKTRLVRMRDGDAITMNDTDFSYTPEGIYALYDSTREEFFGIAKKDAGHFIAWTFNAQQEPYLITADFTGMNVKQALDECAKTFLCWHKRIGRYSARFYHRDYNVGMFIMGLGHYEQDTPIMQKWQHSYDAVKVTGIDGVWEAGNIAYDSKVLSISTRFIDHTIGQTIAQWHFNFFNSLVPRRLFLTRAIYLPQLEIGDKVILTHEYTGAKVNTIVWRREYLAADQAFKFQLLETFDDFALQCVNQLQLKDDVIVMED